MGVLASLSKLLGLKQPESRVLKQRSEYYQDLVNDLAKIHATAENVIASKLTIAIAWAMVGKAASLLGIKEPPITSEMVIKASDRLRHAPISSLCRWHDK